VRITVNGIAHEIDAAPLTPLLHVLREELHITSPKAGCQQGSCGTCTVIVDGEARRSCLLPLAAVEGASITTLEGIGTPDNLSPVQAAFLAHSAAQCGFCTPGFVTATTALLDANPAPSSGEIREALCGHYCRCTGYVKILEAVESVAGVAQ
jgi:aerobic-type carbon monoxide dehydrogenase small subunit (CoxS/CutS family)